MTSISTSSIQKNKKALRTYIKEIRGRLREEDTQAWNNAITQSVCGLRDIQKASTVSLYVSLPGEVSTEAIRSYCIGMGKTVAVPKVVAGNLEFYKVTKDSDLEPGIFGLLEPKITCPTIDTKAIEVFLIPGLAFDRAGHRLGWGKGYYDRILPSSRGAKIALAYDFQIIDNVPVSPTDIPVERIITESGIIQCA